MATAKKTTKKEKELEDGDIKESTKTSDAADSQKEEVATDSGTEAVTKANVKSVAKEAEAEETQDQEDPKEDQKLAKAGKRSAKAIKEAEEKQAKEERKKSKEEAEEKEKPKQQQKPARPKVERSGKKYREASKKVEKGKSYTANEAVELALKTATTKFDSTVEAHIRLNVDPKQADQNVRDTIVLPAGTGKAIKVAVFANAENVAKAKKAGADIALEDEFLEKLEKQEIDFDVLVATPDMMPKLGKYARILGPKGLMPNPKSGTVTTDVAKAVQEAKAGKVEYRVDSTGIIHVGIGKVSFGKEKISQNVQSLFASVKANKPSSLKGSYVRTIYLTTTMGPSISIANNEL